MNNSIIPQQLIISDLSQPQQMIAPQINQNIPISQETMDKSKKKFLF